jgi:hypothetical protein
MQSMPHCNHYITITITVTLHAEMKSFRRANDFAEMKSFRRFHFAEMKSFRTAAIRNEAAGPRHTAIISL